MNILEGQVLWFYLTYGSRSYVRRAQQVLQVLLGLAEVWTPLMIQFRTDPSPTRPFQFSTKILSAEGESSQRSRKRLKLGFGFVVCFEAESKTKMMCEIDVKK